MIAFIKRRKAAQARRRHQHGPHPHAKPAHHKGRKAKKTAAARKIPAPKPQTVAA